MLKVRKILNIKRTGLNLRLSYASELMGQLQNIFLLRLHSISFPYVLKSVSMMPCFEPGRTNKPQLGHLFFSGGIISIWYNLYSIHSLHILFCTPTGTKYPWWCTAFKSSIVVKCASKHKWESRNNKTPEADAEKWTQLRCIRKDENPPCRSATVQSEENCCFVRYCLEYTYRRPQLWTKVSPKLPYRCCICCKNRNQNTDDNTNLNPFIILQLSTSCSVDTTINMSFNIIETVSVFVIRAHSVRIVLYYFNDFANWSPVSSI